MKELRVLCGIGTQQGGKQGGEGGSRGGLCLHAPWGQTYGA